MTDRRHVSVPVGLKATRWTTFRPSRTVLLVAHNVTTVTRLLDVLPALENDTRVQLVFTQIGADPFQHGLDKAVADTGIIAIPWEQATSTEFDLAISASHHGELGDIAAPKIILSHGIGYTKYSPRKPEAGSRKPEAGSRKPEAGSRKPFGISAHTVLHDGEPINGALILSHEEQLRQLAESAPAAVPTAVVAGDPCFDRITASLGFRDRYRTQLGVGDRTLVLISSTWSESALLGRRPELLRELAAELPLDEYLITVALHPNISHGHGPGQISRWFTDCLRAGMLILPEIDGWRAGLIAADIVIGDHGSVAGYAAAIDRPVLLGTFDDVPPRTPIAALGELAGRLPPIGPFHPHLTNALVTHVPGRFAAVTDLVTSAPGQSLRRLRALCYQLLDLPEPAAEVPIEIVPLPQPDNRWAGVFADLVSTEVDATNRLVRIVRHAAEVQRPGIGRHRDRDGGVHLSCSIDYPIRSLVDNAAVLTTDLPPAFDRHPACLLIATLNGDEATVWHRNGPALTMASDALPTRNLASIAYAWHSAGQSLESLRPMINVELGGRRHEVRVRQSSG